MKVTTMIAARDSSNNSLNQEKTYLSVIAGIKDKGKKPDEKISSSIKFLQSLKSTNVGTYSDYIKYSSEIIEELQTSCFKEEDSKEQYKFWLRFLDIVNKAAGDFSDDNGFIKGINNILQKHLIDKGNKFFIDWRIGRKLLEMDLIVDDRTVKISDIKTQIKSQISKAKEILLFRQIKSDTESVKLATQYLDKIDSLLVSNDKEIQKEIDASIISGRFDKHIFDLDHTLIIGEDGGLYVLLNSVNKDERKMIESVVGADYLRDKSIPKNDNSGDEKLIIGKGAFGVVRFALNLLKNGTDASPGDIICIKKTDSFKELSNKGDAFKPTPIEQVTEATLGDYLTNDLAQNIYAPTIYDMSLVTNKRYLERVTNQSNHQKGYLMMHLFPHNTATKIFAQPQYSVWQHQKIYLVNVLHTLNMMLKDGIVMTDLKPDNTLYDPALRNASLIDLGGSVKLHNKEELYEFKSNNYSLQYTKEFTAPELIGNKEEDKAIDISKSLSYSFGKLMEVVTKKVTHGKSEVNYNLKNVNKTIKLLISLLTHKDPTKRPSLDKVEEIITKLGQSDHKEIITNHYVDQLQRVIDKTPESISINKDIKDTKKVLIKQEVTTLDPTRYKNLEVKALSQKFDEFLDSEKQVLLLLGAAGTGKSISLQLRFMEAIEDWSYGDPIPIYFNLANISPDSSLTTIIKDLDAKLNSNISSLIKEETFHLYVDSYDEGIGDQEKVNLVQKYLSETNPETKLIISCRSDYLNDDDKYFKIDENKITETVEKYYITGINYNPESSLANNIDFYLKCNKLPYNATEYLEKIEHFGLEKLIKTGLDFKMLMEADIINNNISNSYELFENYLKQYTKVQISNINPNILEHVETKFKSAETLCDNLTSYIAARMHIEDKVRLNQDDILFKFLNYQKDVKFSYQAAKSILKLLPLKIEFNQSSNGDKSISVGFLHDKIKNYYLIKSIISKLKAGDGSLLAARSIVEDITLLRSIIEVIENDKELKEKLIEQVINTKHDKSPEAITAAANAITLLVGAKHSFSGEDLSNISIKGANIRNGIFHKTNFEKADLTDVNLTNVNLVGANLKGARLTNINLSINPDLIGHKYCISAVNYSPDGNYIITSSWDDTVKIWDAKTKKEIATLCHTGDARSVEYSPDGNYILVRFSDEVVKVWDAETKKEIDTFAIKGSNYEDQIIYSPDSKYLIYYQSGSTVKIKELASGQDIATLCHTDWINSVAYSPDGKHIVTGSGDKTAIIWDAKTGKKAAILEGHTCEIDLVSYSPDGQHVATSSFLEVIIWDAKTGKKAAILEGHESHIKSIAYSPNGNHMVTAFRNGAVKIWDAHTWTEITIVGGYSATHSPDKKYMVTVSDNKTIKILDARTKKEIVNFRYTDEHSSVVYSPDGKHVVTDLYDDIAIIWDAKTKQKVTTLSGHDSIINSVAFSLDGKYVVTGSSDHTAIIWDAKTGQKVTTLSGHDSIINSVAFSPDGNYLVTGSHDKTAIIWDAKTGQKVTILSGHDSIINLVAFSPDGKHVLTDSQDETSKIWDARTGNEITTLSGYITHIGFSGNTNRMDLVAFSSDGNYIVSGSDGETVEIYDLNTGENLYTIHLNSIKSLNYSIDEAYIVILYEYRMNYGISIFDATTYQLICNIDDCGIDMNYIDKVTYSFDGKYIIIESYLQGAIKIIDATTYQQITTFTKKESTDILTHSNDYKYVALFSGGGTLEIYDIVAGIKILTYQCDILIASAMCFSPNNKNIITNSREGEAIIWDIKTEQQVTAFSGHDATIDSVAFSADGNFFVTVSKDKTAIIWNTKTGEKMATLWGHANSITSVAYSPDGRHVLTGSEDATAKIWDAKTGENLYTLLDRYSITSVAYSPDGNYILTVSWQDNVATIWDANKREEIFFLEGHEDTITSATYLPDGKHVLTGSKDKTAIIWDTKTGEKTAILKGHTDKIKSITYSPDGKHVVTGSKDKTAIIWDAKTGEKTTTLKGHVNKIKSVTYSPDGNHILTSSSNEAIVWNTATGEQITILELRMANGNRCGIKSANYSPDGKYIITSSFFDAVKIWNSLSGEEITTLNWNTDATLLAQYSRDGNQIITISNNHTIKIWVNKNNEWLLEREIAANETGFIATGADLTGAINLSDKYSIVLKQREAKLKNIKTQKKDIHKDHDDKMLEYQEKIKEEQNKNLASKKLFNDEILSSFEIKLGNNDSKNYLIKKEQNQDDILDDKKPYSELEIHQNPQLQTEVIQKKESACEKFANLLRKCLGIKKENDTIPFSRDYCTNNDVQEVGLTNDDYTDMSQN